MITLTTTTTSSHPDAIVIRHATGADAGVLARLAALDERAPLNGAALIAEVDGVPRAALDLSDASHAADPFAPTAELVELLRLHGRRAHGLRGGRRLRAPRPRAATAAA